MTGMSAAFSLCNTFIDFQFVTSLESTTDVVVLSVADVADMSMSCGKNSTVRAINSALVLVM